MLTEYFIIIMVKIKLNFISSYYYNDLNFLKNVLLSLIWDFDYFAINYRLLL